MYCIYVVCAVTAMCYVKCFLGQPFSAYVCVNGKFETYMYEQLTLKRLLMSAQNSVQNSNQALYVRESWSLIHG